MRFVFVCGYNVCGCRAVFAFCLLLALGCWFCVKCVIVVWNCLSCVMVFVFVVLCLSVCLYLLVIGCAAVCV